MCADYFSREGTTPGFRHRLYRPGINADKRVLYLAAWPTTANAGTTYADTNNFEFAAVRLDEEGQPRELLLPFLSETSGYQGLVDGVRHEPALNRIFLTYYSSISWLDLDEKGLPISGKGQFLHHMYEFYHRNYVAKWNRFFALRSTSLLINFVWNVSQPTPEYVQSMQITSTPPRAGVLPVNHAFRKLYLLDSNADRALVLLQLDNRGTFTGLPKRFDIGPTTRIDFDFSRRLLYAFGKDVLRIFTLGEDGYPRGEPQVTPLAVGDIRDVWVDEATGKVYVVCTKPPSHDPE